MRVKDLRNEASVGKQSHVFAINFFPRLLLTRLFFTSAVLRVNKAYTRWDEARKNWVSRGVLKFIWD